MLPALKAPVNLAQQLVQVYRLADIVIEPGPQALLLVSFHGECGHGYDRNAF